jgi:hypothetical protein
MNESVRNEEYLAQHGDLTRSLVEQKLFNVICATS